MAIAARPTVLADVLIPRHWVQTQVNRAVVDFALMFGFAWFVALFAQLAIRLPWTPVPITGQTFAVLVAGGALGAWRGAGALLIYMIMGMIAVPVFAPSTSALAMDGTWGVHVLFPWLGSAAFPWAISSGGYIVGFILAAWVVGHFAEKSWDRKTLGLLAMLAANAILYVPGLLWLAYLIATEWIVPGYSPPTPLGEFIAGDGTWSKTLQGGLYPFIVGDLMKLYAATLTLPAAWALVRKIRPDTDDSNES